MDPHLPAVLLMGGGEGIRAVKETAMALGEALFDEELDKPIGQIVVICGRNQILSSTLQSVEWRIPLKIRGFETQMQKWMGAFDCIITKARPGTIAEALIIESCDLYHGKWIYGFAGPLYTNNSCPIITQMQNCQENGRPDKDYENWKWKPEQCDLPCFDARKFLELMRGKTLALIRDSVAQNQMESMMCILWQAPNFSNKRRDDDDASRA